MGAMDYILRELQVTLKDVCVMGTITRCQTMTQFLWEGGCDA